MRAWITAAGALMLLSGCGTAASPVTPRAPAPGTPIARSNAAIAYDPATGQTVLFGGLGANGALGDTWVWDGSRWLQEHPEHSPHSRIAASMTYDPALQALVLVGGDADAPIGAAERADMAATWLWTGGDWVRRDTAHSPVSGQPPFGSGSGPMAYDPATQSVVMVVRGGAPHLIPCSATTWIFDGTDWRQASPATPLPATFVTVVAGQPGGQVLAIVAARAAVAPAGLASAECPAGSPQARALPQPSTWEWTGTTWTQVSSGTEPATTGSAPELDPVAGAAEVVRPGDESVWSWTGSGWRQAPAGPERPPARTDAQVALDRDGHTVLFGGYVDGATGGYRYDTWIWDGSVWTGVSGPVPPTPTPSPSVFTPPVN